MGTARSVRLSLESSGKIRKIPRHDTRPSNQRLLKPYESNRWLLVFGHGFGDHVQFTGAMRELRSMFPEKAIDVSVSPEFRGMFRELADNCLSVGVGVDRDAYDMVVEVGWSRFDTPSQCFPAVRAAKLFSDLGLPIGERRFAYSLPTVSDRVMWEASCWLDSLGSGKASGRHKVVLIHYEGATLKHEKDLRHADISPLIEWCESNAFTPVIIGDSNPWTASGRAAGFRRRDWEWLAAVASGCYACVGIDSGPGHVFVASAKRAIMSWTGHHPVNYCPPSSNTCHLVPEGHESLAHNSASLGYFARNYVWMPYETIGHSIVDAIKQNEPQVAARSQETITLNVPQGLGDVIWVYRKFAKYFKRIDLRVIMTARSAVQMRSFEWLRLLPKIGSISPLVVPEREYNERISKKRSVVDVVKEWRETSEPQDYSCNAWLDAGTKLDDICAGDVEWDAAFQVDDPSVSGGDHIAIAVSGSTGKIPGTWSADQWKDFIDLAYERLGIDSRIVMLGAEFDRAVVEELAGKLSGGYRVSLVVGERPEKAINAIRTSRYFIGYQSGLNIVADMYRIPQTIVYFNSLRSMADSWVNPKNRHLFHFGCFEDGPECIAHSIPERFCHPREVATATLGTWGLGDFIAAYGFMTESERSAIETVYWASRNRELLEPLVRRAFPAYSKSVEAVTQFGPQDSEGFCVVDEEDLRSRLGVEIPETINPLDINTIVRDVRAGKRRFASGRLYSEAFADISSLGLPGGYWVIHPNSQNAAKSFRDLSPAEWDAAVAYLNRHNRNVVVVNDVKHRFSKTDAIDLSGRLSLLESLEVVRKSSGFIGCSSVFSVLASKVLPELSLHIKGHWSLRHNCWDVYYSPLRYPSFLHSDLSFLRHQYDVDPVLLGVPSRADGGGRMEESLEIVDRLGVAWQPYAGQEMEYGRGYWDQYVAREGTRIGVRINRARAALVEKYAASVLDVGIGAGSFIKACVAAKWGSDINPIAREWLSARAMLWDWDCGWPPGCEGVCFWDVLEHTSQPSLWLNRVPPGCYAFITIPVVDTSNVRSSKHYQPGEHLFYWSREGFAWFVDQCGLDVIEQSDAEQAAGRESVCSWVLRRK